MFSEVQCLKRFMNSFFIPSSLLPSDFPGSDGRVCRGGFPPHSDGEVCLLQLEVCEEELAVRHLGHRRLHQLHDHHVSQRGGCLDKLHLAHVYIFCPASIFFVNHLFRTLCQEISHPQPENLFSWDSFSLLSLTIPRRASQTFACWCSRVLSSCQVYEKVAYLLTNLGELCAHAACICAFIISRFPDGGQPFIFSSPTPQPLSPPLQSIRGQSPSGRTASLWRCSSSSL